MYKSFSSSMNEYKKPNNTQCSVGFFDSFIDEHNDL